MPRFFKEDFEKAPYIDGNDAIHISRSLRMKTGESLVVCDGTGYDYHCMIKQISSDMVELEVLQKVCTQSEPDISVTLCTCLLKGDKFEDVIKHSVELGVFEIQPILSENCVSRPDAKALSNKLSRWQKISAEAAGQCGRGIIPKINPVKKLVAFSEEFALYDLVLFFYEAGGEPLGTTFWNNDTAKKIAIITGPEGGFSMEEAELLKNKGAATISLGKRILRAETAPLAALTGIMLLTDNLE